MSGPDDTTRRIPEGGSALDQIDLPQAPPRGPNADVVALLEQLQAEAADGRAQGAVVLGTQIPAGVGFMGLGTYDSTSALVAIHEAREIFFDAHISDDGSGQRTELVQYEFVPQRFDVGEKKINHEFAGVIDKFVASAKQGIVQGVVVITLRSVPPFDYTIQPAGHVLLRGTVGALTMAEVSVASQALVMMQQQQQSQSRIIRPG